MDRPSPELVDCPSCRIKNFAIDDRCAACGASLTVVILPRPKVRRVALATVMVLVAVFAVCFGALRQSLPLGIAATMVLVPAALRTMLEYESRKTDGRPLSSREVMVQAIEALTISILLLPLSAAVCLLISMTILEFHKPNIEIVWISQIIYGTGVLLGIAISFFLARKLWPRKN